MLTFAVPSFVSEPLYCKVASPLTLTLEDVLKQDLPSTVISVRPTSSDNPATEMTQLSSLN